MNDCGTAAAVAGVACGVCVSVCTRVAVLCTVAAGVRIDNMGRIEVVTAENVRRVRSWFHSKM